MFRNFFYFYLIVFCIISCSKGNNIADAKSHEISNYKKKNNFRRDISYLTFSKIGKEILAQDLEGSSFKTKKFFFRCEGKNKYVLSAGLEYVIKNRDLQNKGLLHQAGLEIQKFLTDDFINYLKNKRYKDIIILTKEEYNKWKNKAFKNALSKEGSIKLFDTYISEDHEYLKKVIKVHLSQNEFDAIICALYNLGSGYLKNINFFKTLNERNRIKALFILASARSYKLNRSFSCKNRWNDGQITNEDFLKMSNERSHPQNCLHGWIKRDFIQTNIFTENSSFYKYLTKPSDVYREYIKNIFKSGNNILKILNISMKHNIYKNILDTILNYSDILTILVDPKLQNITNKFWFLIKKRDQQESEIRTISKKYSQYKHNTLKNRISGPLIITIKGYMLTQEAKSLLKNNTIIGGIIFFKYNIESKEQLRALIKDIKKVRPDILIFIDQEGGLVQRLKGSGFDDKFPAAKKYGETYDNNPKGGLNYAYDNGKKIGLLLKELDIDVNLAPVLDLEREGSLISNTKRSFHKNHDVVSKINIKFTKGLKESEIFTFAKHFPGHSCISKGQVDSHTNLLFSSFTIPDLEKQHLKPFIYSVKNKVNDGILLAHIIFPKVDSNPVSLSKEWISYLRDNLGWQGFIMTDCLSMSGANIGSISKRVMTALKAGNDGILVCHQSVDCIKSLISQIKKIKIYF